MKYSNYLNFITSGFMLILLAGCANFQNNNDEYNSKFTKCTTFKVSGDSTSYKNMQIYANKGYLYFKTNKVQNPQNLKLYAVKNDGSLSLVQYWISDSDSKYTIFKTPEGFSKYAIKNDFGGVVYMSCEQGL